MQQIVLFFLLLIPFISQSYRNDWATYVNTKYNYQISYPPTYTIRACSQGPDLQTLDGICIDKNLNSPAGSSWVEFSLQVNPRNKFGQLHCETEDECIAKWKLVFDQKEFTDLEENINGEQVKGFSFNQKSSWYTGKTSIFFVLHKPAVFFMSVSDGNIAANSREETDQEISRILSTFHFIQF